MKILNCDKFLMSKSEHFLINIKIKKNNKKYEIEASYSIMYHEMIPTPIEDFVITVDNRAYLTPNEIQKIKNLALERFNEPFADSLSTSENTKNINSIHEENKTSIIL